MAKNDNAAAEPVQKTPAFANKVSKAQILANRMKAVENAGNMTPKMQRNFDRFAAKIEG